MTPDKDFAQIVGPNIYQYKPAYMGKPAEIYGVKEILNKWEVNSIEQVIDVLGLMGDSIDNVPGIPGVGFSLLIRSNSVLVKPNCALVLRPVLVMRGLRIKA